MLVHQNSDKVKVTEIRQVPLRQICSIDRDVHPLLSEHDVNDSGFVDFDGIR